MKKTLSFIALFFIVLQVSAQKNLQYAPDENSLLWEITGKGLKDTTYLFGTYHFAGSSFLDTLPVVNEIFKNAEIVVGETRMQNEILVTAQLIPHMKMTGQKLDQLLSPAEYEMVNKYLIEISDGLHLNMFATTKPAALQRVMMRYAAPTEVAADEKLIDLYFQQEGEKLKKEVIGLETIAEQGKLQFGGSIKTQKKHLIKFVKEADKQQKQAAEIFELYKAQDLEKLEKAFTRNQGYSSVALDNLLKNRNRKWMEKLPAIMQKGSAFIAVGGGHLIGKHSLLKLLRKAGYTVRPINTQAQ